MTKVMIAGIGGASLGTELLKCLRLAGGYEPYGCDISRHAYGVYDPGFAKAFVVPETGYVAAVVGLCLEHGIRFLVPGGERPMVLLGEASDLLRSKGIALLGNAPGVISVCGDKNATSRLLESAGIPVPRHVVPTCEADIARIGLPCIVKPATGSGGSASVFFATTAEEAMIYAEFIRKGGVEPAAQEYMDDCGGEYTVGVLSLPDGSVAGSIAMRRILESKLSVSFRGRGGLISSGYSQGRIEAFPEICAQAERIAEAVGSRGPVNVQGRLREGVLVPFEINPRFSASTYLRAMAGFNELDIFLRHLMGGRMAVRKQIRPGLYLRTLSERYVAQVATP